MMTWEDLKQDQPRVSKVLDQSLLHQRVAHAYIFTGPDGTRIDEAALLFAQRMLCRSHQPESPCGECSECRRVLSGNHPDVHDVRPDGASIKIDQIRALQKEFSYTSMEAGIKVYFVHEAHLLTVQAANSLLKFLEEPERNTVAILLTSRPSSLLETILSRCQMLTFQPLSREALLQKLHGEGISKAKAALLSSLTQDPSTALAWAEDEWFATARNVVIQLNKALVDQPRETLPIVQEDWLNVLKDTDHPALLFDILLLWHRDILMVQTGETERLSFPDQQDVLHRQHLQQSKRKTADQVAVILETRRNLDVNANIPLLLEQMAFRLQEG
ncbi:DNA polymerase III subunit delta' [Bacillaceae bacterium SIJ1]|uniref:DNA polymerase III subunit delta' n=1 Tax=Litoribacterium kuwaitense TaxID=1398745 RepID=UPI0013EAB04F|nr:DNA polymerase III subunit delta' [Litoribacterium kuwaitense]NGP45782.1 DNA polymerase III subunit delta' [Litoribacterium kuwaitense]